MAAYRKVSRGLAPLRPALLLCLVLAALAFPATPPAAAALPDERLGERLADLLWRDEPIAGRPLPMAALRRLYAGRDFRPLWMTSARLNARGQIALDVLTGSFDEGLDPSSYFSNEIQRRLVADTNAGETPAAARPAPDAVELELLLSAGLLAYVNDVAYGRIEPRESAPQLFRYPEGPDPVAVLEGLLTAPDLAAAFAGLPPPHAGYRRLKAALAAYRAIADRGGWPTVLPGEKLEPGSRGPRVLALRQRLAITDGAPWGGPDDALFDDPLEAAVKRAQARHGLAVDGIVGPRTLAALNVSVEQRIRQIAINMERWRWLPAELGARYLFINAAAFRLSVFEQGEERFGMSVIVGRPYRRTPLFRGELSYIVLNPTWTVPPSIARKDILPKLRHDTAYLAEQGFTVYSDWSAEAEVLDPTLIDWGRLTGRGFPYKLVQRPGPLNALGRVKFMLPNRYNVYLHDTPNQRLFDSASRAFSSGCVRLSDPDALLAYVLTGLKGWDMARVRAVWADGTTRQINLPQTIPVYFTYFTAMGEAGGVVAFRSDIYERDSELFSALREELTAN